MDDLTQTNEPSDAENAAAEVAFATGFNDTSGQNLPSETEPAKVETETKNPAADVDLESQPTPAANAPDPYAGLPDDVKAALATIPTLTNELRRTSGQVRALQSAHDRAAAAAQAAPVEVTRSTAYEQVASTLPEVVTTIEEIVEQRMKERAPAPAERHTEPGDTRSPDEIRLDDGFPQWREIASGNDFKVWAASQQDASVIQSTKDMVTFMGAITRFKAHESAQTAVAQEAQRQAALRTSRIDASLTPTRGAVRRPSATQTEEDAFNEGFKTRAG